MEVRLLGRLGLVVSHKSEGYEHGGIDCNGIVDQRADDLLDEADRFGERRGEVSSVSEYWAWEPKTGKFQECGESWERAGARC